MTPKQIRLELRRLREEMREAGVRRISCFNGGLTDTEYRYNAELFRLQTLLRRATRALRR